MKFIDFFKRILLDASSEIKRSRVGGNISGYNRNYQNIYKAKIKNKRRKSG